MARSLALANILHRKVRSAMSVSAVALGICMLITLLGLSHGTLEEVVNRVVTVDADLLVLPEGRSVIFTSGAPLSDNYIAKIEGVTVDGVRAVERAIPAFFQEIKLGGQENRVIGVDRDAFKYFLGDRKWVDGRLFDEGNRFKKLLDSKRNERGSYQPESVTDEELHLGCELVIDSRLARVGGYEVGDQVTYLGRTFTIVGVFEVGPAARVFAPIQTLRHILNTGIPWSSIFFVRLSDAMRQRGPAGERAAVEAVRELTRLNVIPKSAYEGLLREGFAAVYVFINVFSLVVLIFAVFFVLLTTYTMVLERTREVGILKSLGAGRLYLVRQCMTEALLLSCVGTVLGMLLSYGARYAIEKYQPLMTVDISARFLLLAGAVGVLAGVIGSLYPAVRVTRLDPATALSFE